MFRITRVLSVGRFATPERADELRTAGVTHILNVAEAPVAICANSSGFHALEWVPLEDRSPIPPHTLIRLLDTLHDMTVVPDSHVYIHCIAGQTAFANSIVAIPDCLWRIADRSSRMDRESLAGGISRQYSDGR